MAASTGTCTTIQQIRVSVFGLGADGTSRVQLTGPITVSLSSGGGTFTTDPATPYDFVASSDVEGESVYSVVAAAGNGQAELTDTFTLTVTADTTTPVATTLGFDVGAPEPKAR